MPNTSSPLGNNPGFSTNQNATASSIPNNPGFSTNQNAIVGSGSFQPLANSFSSISGANPSPPAPSTMDAKAIADNTSNPGFQFPQNQPNPSTTMANAMTTNSSVPNPIPSAESITGQQTQQTPAEQTNQGLLGRLAGLIGNKSSLATLQTQQESQAGIPGMTKTVNDLNTQLEGLNNQATALANAAQPGGAIENQQQLNAIGRGITVGGQAPLTAAEMRKNQIQQSTITSQALTVKSAVYAAQGNLTLAKDAADKAAQVAFDAETQQIDYMNALIDQNKPQMTKEEKAQADTVTAQLADRTRQIQVQQESFKTGQAAIADAMKNNPDDPAAQFAAQQAMKIDSQDPNYLQKVTALVGNYASDVAQRALDMQSKQSQIEYQKGQEALQPGQLELQKGQIAQLPLDAALKRAQIQNAQSSTQNTLEQQYRTALEKQFSARSGSLGVQSQKVDQAIHLRTLLDQYKDANGNYNVPKAQYAELAQGMASLLSGNNSLSDSRVNDIQQRSIAGDLGGLLTYVTGTNFSGSTQDILANLSDSIDRQGSVAQKLRDQYVSGLKGLKPTGLDQSRADSIAQDLLPSYDDALKGKYGSGSQNNTTKSGKSFDYAKAKADGVSDSAIQAYLASH